MIDCTELKVRYKDIEKPDREFAMMAEKIL